MFIGNDWITKVGNIPKPTLESNFTNRIILLYHYILICNCTEIQALNTMNIHAKHCTSNHNNYGIILYYYIYWYYVNNTHMIILWLYSYGYWLSLYMNTILIDKIRSVANTCVWYLVAWVCLTTAKLKADCLTWWLSLLAITLCTTHYKRGIYWHIFCRKNKTWKYFHLYLIADRKNTFETVDFETREWKG